MRPSTACIQFVLSLSVLASCTSPPKPPTVDESSRRPANTAAAVELQVCRSELQNTRLMASESGRVAQATSATVASLASRQKQLADLLARQAYEPRPNTLVVIHFDYGSSRVEVPAATASALIREAKAAPLIVLRGRTDGMADTPAEGRMARDRANAVRDYLTASGVDPSRIRATYQPSGDHSADNADAHGRSLNRRVEIEVYRIEPASLAATQ